MERSIVNGYIVNVKVGFKLEMNGLIFSKKPKVSDHLNVLMLS